MRYINKGTCLSNNKYSQATGFVCGNVNLTFNYSSALYFKSVIYIGDPYLPCQMETNSKQDIYLERKQVG